MSFISVDQIILKHAKETPSLFAFEFEQEDYSKDVFSFKRLKEKCMALASEIAQNSTPGERCLIVLEPGSDYVISFYASLMAGLIAVPVYPPMRGADFRKIRNIIKDTAPTVALVGGRTKKVAPLMRLNQIFSRKMTIVDVKKDFEYKEGFRPHDNIYDNVAFIQYSSGTTGNPKGVMVSHGNLVENIKRVFQGQTKSGLPAVSWLPPYHDMGLIGGILAPLYLKNPLYLMSPFTFVKNPLRWLQTITRTKAAYAMAPNFSFDLCVRKITQEQKSELNLSSLESVLNGADIIRKKTLDNFSQYFSSVGFKKSMFYPAYGLAECTLQASGAIDLISEIEVFEKVINEKRYELISCGQALKDHSFKIVCPKSNEQVDAGEIGEIHISGPCVAKGYWKRDDLNETYFYRDEQFKRFLKTGDLGILKNGELFVCGRIKDTIIVNGVNYFPADVEITLETASELIKKGRSAVFSVTEGTQQKVVALFEINKENINKADEIKELIKRKVAFEMSLKLSEVIALNPGSVQKTTSGKVRRSTMKDMYINGELKGQVKTKKSITAIFKPQKNEKPTFNNQILQVIEKRAKINISPDQMDTPFGEFGVDSIIVMEILGDLEKIVGKSISPIALYNNPNINSLSNYLNEYANE